MITNIANANDALAALNENFSKLVKKERKVIEAKEVNNTIGKMTNVVKAMLVEKMRIGDREPILWLTDSNTNRLLADMKQLQGGK